MKAIYETSQFRKDIKKLKRQGKEIDRKGDRKAQGDHQTYCR